MNILDTVNRRVVALLRVTTLIVMLGLSVVTQAQSGTSLNEIPVSIKAFNVEKNTVTLAGLGFPEKEYRMAFDIEIKLMGGEQGTVSGLEIEDRVTAIVSASDDIVQALHVVAKP